MNSGMNVLLLVLGIIEIVFGIFMEKFTRAKYANEKVKDIEGLVKWERITTMLIGIFMLIFSVMGFMGYYERYSNIIMIIIVVLMVVTYTGRKRYIRG
ncbi:hypothetical protein GOM49_10600 [Clostridium bovifaecis]|uniref:DUF3784 domain-containing protein n=1 Tax=Clostridium bovifaecis TaxID=2184719 RepID=A0A6I6F507_9CLOT|nr:hypothetical protein GOM49_10600 [Clostridium bovifaecis]